MAAFGAREGPVRVGNGGSSSDSVRPTCDGQRIGTLAIRMSLTLPKAAVQAIRQVRTRSRRCVSRWGSGSLSRVTAPNDALGAVNWPVSIVPIYFRSVCPAAMVLRTFIGAPLAGDRSRSDAGLDMQQESISTRPPRRASGGRQP
jgi:hypothetical protein